MKYEFHLGADVDYDVCGKRGQGRRPLCRSVCVRGFVTPPGPAGTNFFKVLRYTGDAQHGVIEWEWRGQHVGDFLGVPAAGKETVVRGMTFHTYENGKIVREATFWDAVTALQQLGALKPTMEFWKVSGKPLSPSGPSV
jgi:SnoaL-like polyketide cyclase